MTTEQELLKSHLTRVLERGKAIVPALRAVAEELPDRRRRQLSQMVDVLERGDADEAVAAVSAFPDYWLPLLSAATVSSDPGRVLRVFLDEAGRANEIRRSWRKVLVYPAILAGLTAVVITLLALFVVPIFRQIFDDFKVDLPNLTVMILNMSSLFESGRILIVIAVALVVGVLLVNARRLLPRSARNWFGDRFGQFIGQSMAIARFARFLADLLDVGLDIPNALKIAGFASEQSSLGRAAACLAEETLSTQQVAHPPHTRSMATIQYALQADLSTEARVRLLQEISTNFAERARKRYSWSRGIIEPVAILVIGLIVAGTAIGLFLPLIKLIESLT